MAHNDLLWEGVTIGGIGVFALKVRIKLKKSGLQAIVMEESSRMRSTSSSKIVVKKNIPICISCGVLPAVKSFHLTSFILRAFMPNLPYSGRKVGGS